MVRVATSQVSEKDIEGGGNYPAPGMYHVMIDTVREMVDDNYVAVDFVVLTGAPTDPAAGDQSGKKITERFYLTGQDEKKTATCNRRLSRLAVETGRIDRSQLGQEDLDVEFSTAEGTTCVIKVVEQEYTNKEGNKAKRCVMDFFGIWNVNHEDVQQVPKDPKWVIDTTSSPSTTSRQPVGAAANGSASADDFNDI